MRHPVVQRMVQLAVQLAVHSQVSGGLVIIQHDTKKKEPKFPVVFRRQPIKFQKNHRNVKISLTKYKNRS